MLPNTAKKYKAIQKEFYRLYHEEEKKLSASRRIVGEMFYMAPASIESVMKLDLSHICDTCYGAKQVKDPKTGEMIPCLDCNDQEKI